MTDERREQIMAFFDDENDGKEFLQYEKIPRDVWLHAARRLAALLKVASLMKQPEKFDFSASHDVVYLTDLDDLRDDVTDDDLLCLSRMGVHFDDECDCLAMFC